MSVAVRSTTAVEFSATLTALLEVKTGAALVFRFSPTITGSWSEERKGLAL